MTDTRDVAYVRKRLCNASDLMSEVFVKVEDMSKENTKLKELLKEAYPVIEFGDGAMMSKWEANWLAKAKEILGEE